MPLLPVSAETDSPASSIRFPTVCERQREGHFTAVGASSSGEAGSDIEFTGSATAANGTFIINGSTGQDVAGALLNFLREQHGG